MLVVEQNSIPENEEFDFNLPTILFQEDDTILCYCPTLDLVGYGNTEEEAVASYNYILKECISYWQENNTLEIDLLRLGWNIGEDNKWIAPAMKWTNNKEFEEWLKTKS